MQVITFTPILAPLLLLARPPSLARHAVPRVCAPHVDDCEAVRRTLAWLDNFIIGHGLCPFAKAARRQTRIVVCEDEVAEACLDDEIRALRAIDCSRPGTTLVVLPRLTSFEAFMDFQAEVEVLADADSTAARVQVLAFHPEATFEVEDDPADWAMRSPLPTLHLLRDADVEAADAKWVAQHAPHEPPGIQARNAAYLRGLGSAGAQTASRASFQ